MDAATIDLRTDEELVVAATGGQSAAFEELYRRHAQSAWGIALSVTRDRNDAADAVSDAFTRLFQAVTQGKLADVPFRPYLLTATRNASIDILRRSARLEPTDDVDDVEHVGRTVSGPAELAIAGTDAALVSQAFADLPERWRSILWLTEVEGLPAREAADMMGISANGAAQLAVRARAGLKARYLQAHVRRTDRDECRFTLEHLGWYVGGAISARDLAKVDQHLAGCEECRARKDELEDVGTTLRRAIVPIPLFVGAGIFGRMKLASASTSASGSASAPAPATSTAAPATGPASGTAPGALHKALASAAAGLLALGLVTAGVRITDDDDGPSGGVASPDDRPAEVRGFNVTRSPEAVAQVAAPAPPPLPELPDADAGTAPATAPVDEAPAAPPAPVPAPAPQIGDAVIDERPATDAATPVLEVEAGDGGGSGVEVVVGGDAPLSVASAPDAEPGVLVSVLGSDPITLP